MVKSKLELNKDEDNHKEYNTRRIAALKAWDTIRKKELLTIRSMHRVFEFYMFDNDVNKVSIGKYRINPPLIKPSKLTTKDKVKDSSDKDLSDGYAINYAIGCTHACRFCYVDSIHKRFTLPRLMGGKGRGRVTYNVINNNDNDKDKEEDAIAITRSWGMYLLIPENIDEAIDKTNWSRFKDKEVMMSSTHDPYLPQLYPITRKILEVSLPYGVRYCIQTRSMLVLKDLDLLTKYRNQIRLQVSIATLNEEISSLIEPRVSLPRARLSVLKAAKEYGLKTGVIIAPVFPIKGWERDLKAIIKEAKDIADNIYGECIHVRGINIEYLKDVLPSDMLEFELNKDNLLRFDRLAGYWFNLLLKEYNLKGKGRWWYEH